ncbi:hypothetical protein [Alteromonas lipolytica]|uniref:Uncharacterized protein n=1 Tax=Alteromonas lipolytica TaxID=1856405 RepID=A0A1E8FFZ8_9ALTE|nr:hypothetical protein [Alteromonas lipolytica]OFI34850.1 hypothetical protein BFC17_14850 [Alteromonas lipolytica]GGF54500.1 hypothetical protein GCM10011338_03370 [Alteromonas lipolytica]
MNSKSSVTLLELEPQEIRYAKVISGVSPMVLRRVFGAWIFFVALIAGLVTVAPDLSLNFMAMTIAVLMIFTVVIFYQSRISEGWPAIIHYHNRIGVVQDPVARRFLMVSDSLVTDARPHILKPNKKAVAIEIDDSALSDKDRALMQQAIWPEDNQLIALSYFKKREDICASVKQVAGL